MADDESSDMTMRLDQITTKRVQYVERKLTKSEQRIVDILECIACHGMEPRWNDDIFIKNADLKRRGVWRVFVIGKESILLYPVHPPRVRKKNIYFWGMINHIVG